MHGQVVDVSCLPGDCDGSVADCFYARAVRDYSRVDRRYSRAGSRREVVLCYCISGGEAHRRQAVSSFSWLNIRGPHWPGWYTIKGIATGNRILASS